MEPTSTINEEINRLYQQCDAKNRGYVTREDLNCLKVECSFTDQQLDEVFKLLDKDNTGQITLKNFLHGLDEIFSATDAIIPDKADQQRTEVERSDQSLTNILTELDISDIAKDYEQIFHIWSALKQGNPETLTEFEQMLGRIFTEIKKATDEFANMEQTFQCRINKQHDHMTRLIEDMEHQMISEKERLEEKIQETERKLRQQLTDEIHCRDKALQDLMQQLDKASGSLNEMNKCYSINNQEKERLKEEKHNLETKLNAIENELLESREYVLTLEEKTKHDKKKRAHAALELGENTALERENLVRELQSLKIVNQKLSESKLEAQKLGRESSVQYSTPADRSGSIAPGHLRLMDSLVISSDFDEKVELPPNLTENASNMRKGSVLGTYLDDNVSHSIRSAVISESNDFEDNPASERSEFTQVMKTSSTMNNRKEKIIFRNGSSSYPRNDGQILEAQRMYKVTFAGESDVGKSSIIHYTTNGIFDPVIRTTISIDFKTKLLTCDGTTVILQLWDTAGQERFRSLTAQYFRKSDAIIIVFDATKQDSLITVRNWLATIEDKATSDVIIMVLSNKNDKIPDWSGNEPHTKNIPFSKLLEEHKLPGYEVSAKTGTNVDKAFMELTRILIKKEDNQWKAGVRLTSTNEMKPGKRCCI